MTEPMPVDVVVVDASPDFRWIIRRVFQRKGGFDVVGDTDDLATGLDLARLHRPQVVLLDVDGAHLDAPAAVRQIRLSCPDASIVATMSVGRNDLRDAVLDAGASGVIRKDVTLQHTFDQLWSALAPQARDQVDAQSQSF
jgi:DNA-binding NarL/FixJ family response regulator